MKQNVVPTYRLPLSLGIGRRLGGVVRRLKKKANALMLIIQRLGSAADGVMFAALRWLGKQAVGRDLDPIEEGKLVLFLHKVIIAAFIAGYVVAYLAR